PGGVQVRVPTASYSPHGGLSIACGAPGVHGRLEAMPHAPGWRGPPVGSPPEGRSPPDGPSESEARLSPAAMSCRKPGNHKHFFRVSGCAEPVNMTEMGRP